MDKNLDIKRLKCEYESLLKAMNDVITPFLVQKIIREKEKYMKEYKHYFNSEEK
jgi:hypothetical protein